MKMIRTIRPPESKQTTTLLVAVKCRPLTSKEQNRGRDILRVVDDKVVVVLDPDSSKEYLDRIQNRTKEKKYAFDIAFGSESRNKDVYNVTVRPMIEGVIRGLNATVFAYGATGSGKTHTMAGTVDDPGLMVLSLQEIFALISKQEYDYEFEVTCSYLEVYNEVIYDLLEKSSGHLELREDPDQGITVAGLKRIQVNSSEKILELLHVGNSRRKTESTNANATSSRSHAVLEIIVKRKQRNQYRSQVLRGKLALVDLAGSERASETNNAGQKLRDGANINRSLLALANCINALGKQQKKGMAYVPYRNSKLTRLLKDGLSGNSRTIMVANVSCSEDQYHHTINTLKYADRAKEIKTHIQMNVGTVDAHVADYQRMIDNLQVEVSHLRRELAEKDTQLSARTPEKTDDQLSWLDVLSQDINENVEERINLQKALFEIEDMNLQNRTELQQLDEMIAQHRGDIDLNGSIEELVERRQVILDNIRDNDEAGAHYRQDIENNEMHRKELQQQIDEAISSNRNKTYLRILSQYRLLGMTNMELQFQMAIRDQIIQDQREALNNMWRLLESSGLNHDQILEVAAQQGIMIEEGMPHGTIPPPGRYSNLMHIPQNMEITRDSNSPSLHSSTPPKSPKFEWKQVENGAISSAMSTSSGFCASPLSNVKIQATSGNSNKDLSPERFREICRQVLLESGVLGRIDCHQPGREASCSCLSRSRSPSAQLARKMAPTTKHRRKLRSSDSRLQHEVFDGSTTGVDAGSESSETEDSDHGMNNSYGRQLHRTDGGSIQPIVDTKMLQKKLSRLDHELKDLKRGMGMSSGTNGYSEPRLTSRNNEMSPVYSNRGNQYPESAPTKPHGSYIHRNDSSQAFVKGTSPIIDKKAWGRLDVAGGDKVTSRVFLFSPPELVDGRALINLRTKALADRLPSIHARQLWTA